MMKTKVFTSDNGLELIIHSRKSAVIWEKNPEQCTSVMDMVFEFGNAEFEEFVNYIEAVAYESWGTFDPKEATSEGADYFEYYDRELDNNGNLWIRNNEVKVSRPFKESDRLYKFNKKKMESFIFDLHEVRKAMLVEYSKTVNKTAFNLKEELA